MLVLITSGIWFLMAYGSPCTELPSKVTPLQQCAPVLHCTLEASCCDPTMAEAQHLGIWPAFRPASWGTLRTTRKSCRDLVVLCSTGGHCWQACMAAVGPVLLRQASVRVAVQVEGGKA